MPILNDTDFLKFSERSVQYIAQAQAGFKLKMGGKISPDQRILDHQE